MYIVSYKKLGGMEYVVYNAHDDTECLRSASWKECNEFINSFN